MALHISDCQFQVRMQARSSMRGSETMMQAFYDIFRQEGVAGLWRVSTAKH